MDTLGFSEVGTYLIQAPPYAVAYIVTLLVSWSSGRMLEHCWHIVVCITVCLAGAVLMISTLNVGARYFGLVLLCSGPFVGLNVGPLLHLGKKPMTDKHHRSRFPGKQQSCPAHEPSVPH